MFKLLPKSKYLTEMLYVLTEHNLIIYVPLILGFQRKTLSLYEKTFKNELEHFNSDSIFKRLKFEYSSSETASSQQIKFIAIFLVTAYYCWRSD